MSLMHTICVVCCWRSNFRLVIVAPLAVKINATSTPSSLKRGRYPACYNQPLLQPAPVSPFTIIFSLKQQQKKKKKKKKNNTAQHAISTLPYFTSNS